MLFASTDLAGRIERAQCRLLVAGAAAIPPARHGEPSFVRPIAGGVAIHAAPGSPLNKLAGLGFGGAIDEAELAAVEQVFAARGTPLQVELSILADPAIGTLLTRRGYVLHGFESVLGRRLPADDLREKPADVTLSAVDDSNFARWVDVVVSGFLTPDTEGVASHDDFPREALEAVISDMARAEGTLAWLARRNGAVAGGGSLRMDADGVAQLSGAATLPAHRRRGVQTALLSHRLHHAATQGCDLAVMTAMPGSKSCMNAMKQGFTPLYAVAVLIREAAA